MLPKLSGLGLVVALNLAAVRPVMAQPVPKPPVKPSGPAATKADNLIQRYTARIEKEIEEGRKEVERLRAELHELIDVRHDIAEAITELRGELSRSSESSAHSDRDQSMLANPLFSAICGIRPKLDGAAIRDEGPLSSSGPHFPAISSRPRAGSRITP